MTLNTVLFSAAAALLLLSVYYVMRAFLALKRRRWTTSLGRAATGVLLLALGALSATLGISMHGYRALTHEELAAVVTTVPAGPGTFHAFVELPDGRTTTLTIAGDQVLVDARILKWHPIANLLGLRTHYELDRMTGRYEDIDDERTQPRTVHALDTAKTIDLFDLARRYTLLAMLVDAEYGSASYVDVRRPARFEVRVSPTGLLIRDVGLWNGEPEAHAAIR